jgi:phenylalanyl-tRNA synthetase alpha chain
MNSGEIASWVADAKSAFKASKNLDDLKNSKILHLGDKSPISLASRSLATVPAEQKAELGKLVGGAKAQIAAEFEKRLTKCYSKRL